jgi:hypothetical protein
MPRILAPFSGQAELKVVFISKRDFAQVNEGQLTAGMQKSE